MVAVTKASLKKQSWKDVRSEVKKVNPELANKIDELNVDDSFALYKVRYPFGNGILQNGELFIPNDDGDLVRVNDESIDDEIKKDLSYTSNMPIGVITKNSIELCCTYDSQIRVTPWMYMLPGRIFGLWSIMQTTQSQVANDEPSPYAGGKMWQILSGARTFFLLSKISNAGNYKRIKKEFNLREPMPLALLDQWPLLVEIANSAAFPEPWYSEVIFFPEKWKNMLHDKSPSWESFVKYLLEYLWADSLFMREQSVSDFAFSIAMTARNLRPNPYLADTFRHLYSIGTGGQYSGAKPGLKFASDDIAGPVCGFQNIFDQLYDLRFSPSIIHPGVLGAKEMHDSIYYSLEIPTVWSYLPKSRKAANKLNDLREIKHIQETITSYILEDKIGLFDTAVYQRLLSLDFSYFHSDEDALGEVLSSKELESSDNTLRKQKKNSSKPFCHTSPFLRGCIRITLK